MSVPIHKLCSGSTGSSRLTYDFVGTGQVAVVLLHGLFGSPRNWHSIMETLAPHFRFFAPQLPVDPHEDRQPAAFQSLSQLTDYVEQFVDSLALTRVVLCGNSLGGQTALDFCLRHPDRVSALVLTGSAGLYERNVTGGRRVRYCRETIREQASQIFHDPVHVTEELVEDMYRVLGSRQYRRFLLRVSKATRDRRMDEELAAVDTPTLIIWGRDDRITPPFVAEQFRSKLPRAELRFIEHCGHAPPIEQPAEFARLLWGFLGQLPSR
ncbi:MAG: alpha/beta fold hydrolase [Pirellulaceae bacterium]|nr:alpha/beta fold hydrolase [Pirellulaceae bacterium]